MAQVGRSAPSPSGAFPSLPSPMACRVSCVWFGSQGECRIDPAHRTRRTESGFTSARGDARGPSNPQGLSAARDDSRLDPSGTEDLDQGDVNTA